MSSQATPHPRFRLYTSRSHYGLPLAAVLRRPDPTREAVRLEGILENRLPAPHALCVPAARTGIFLAVRALVPPGREVILSPLTIADVVSLVIAAGAVPVFADVVPGGCHIDPVEVERLLGPRTGAVLITHLFGQTAGSARFREICRKHGLPLIEDTAQAFGASERGRSLGTWGEVGVFSFGMYKHLTGWRGGLLASPSQDLIGRIRPEVERMPYLPAWRLLGLTGLGLATDVATWPALFARLIYPIFRWGHLLGIAALNRLVDPEAAVRRLTAVPPSHGGRMTGVQTRLVMRGLERLERENEIRRSHAELYRAGLAGLEGVTLLRLEPDCLPVFPYFPVLCRESRGLLHWAFRQGRDIATHSLKNCADLTLFRDFRRDCPNARRASESLILLPTYPRYPVAEIERNIDAIRAFCRRPDRIGSLGME